MNVGEFIIQALLTYVIVFLRRNRKGEMKKNHQSLKRAGPTANYQAGRFVRIRVEDKTGK